MTSQIETAVDKALETLKLKRLCRAVEDDKSFYFTGCGDNGEPIFGSATCRVNKKTMECAPVYHDDPCWKTKKNDVAIPSSRKEVFIERKEYDY